MSPRLGLTQLAQIAEVVAAVAVVISLVYVGRELSSNTAAIRGASMQAIASSSSEALRELAADSALSRIRQLGNENPALLSEAEAYRYETFVRQYWLTMQNVYFQHEFGLLDPRVWVGYTRIICSGWSFNGVMQTWPAHRNALDDGFAALVEACTNEQASATLR